MPAAAKPDTRERLVAARLDGIHRIIGLSRAEPR